MKYQKKPIVVEATQWFKNGDHPLDLTDGSMEGLLAGVGNAYWRNLNLAQSRQKLLSIMKYIILGLLLIVLFPHNTKAGGPMPLGEEAIGVTLEEHLAGKQTYLLTDDINSDGCWKDSVHWTGNRLFYAVTSYDFTKLLLGVLEVNPDCVLPPDQINDNFNIYQARVRGGRWDIKHQSINSVDSNAAMSLSNNTIAYINFGSYDIFLADKLTGDSWSTPVSFEYNSVCKEDNPELYDNGTKIIFESDRVDSLGTLCYPDELGARQLWYSEKSFGVWSEPIILSGPPNWDLKNSQPWVDEINGYLYWTADSGCACIRRIAFDGVNVSGEFEDVIKPSLISLLDGTANGKVVFVGEYSQSNGYAFLSCVIASEEGDGTDPNLFLGQWYLSVEICIIPLKLK